VLNPDLRLTIEQIRRNDWVNRGFSQPPHRPAISIKPSDGKEEEKTKKKQTKQKNKNKTKLRMRKRNNGE
jgi:hypothetical protein